MAIVGILTGAFAVLIWWSIDALPSARTPVDAITILAPLIGVTAALLVAALPAVLPKPPPGSGELHAHVDTLALQVAEREREQNAQLLGRDTRVIDLGLTAEPGPPGGSAPEPPGGLRLSNLLEYYLGLDQRRMVIVGESGAGKTVAAMQLILRWLRKRPAQSGEPVPIRFSLAGWDLSRGLEESLVDHLIDVYPTFSRQVLLDLVRHRLVVPFFDGLDELDPVPGDPVRAKAFVRQLNAYWDFDQGAPFVILCRAGRAEQIMSHEPIEPAVTVRLHSATPAQVAEFLAVRNRRGPDAWGDVRSHLLADPDPDGALAVALSSPWRLTLAITAYNAGLAADPVNLLALPLAELDRYLLAQYVTSATNLWNAVAKSRYRPERVDKWLTQLARYLSLGSAPPPDNRVRTKSDIVLHELWPIAGQRAPRFVHAALIFAILLAVALVFAPGRLAWQLPVVVAAALPGLRWWPAPKLFASSWLGKSASPLRFGVAVACILAYALICIVVLVSLYFALAAVVAIYGLVSLLPLLAGGGVSEAISPGFTNSAEFGFVGVPLLLVGLAIAGAFAQGWKGDPIRRWLLTPLWSVAKRSLHGVFDRYFGVRRLFGVPIADADSATSPRTPITSDLVIMSATGLAVAAAVGLAAVAGSRSGLEPLYVLFVVAAIALIIVFVCFTGAAWRRYIAFLLCSRGLLPWRLGHFLDWACDAGLLRVSGVAYQFRHLELQEFLAQPEPDVAG